MKQNQKTGYYRSKRWPIVLGVVIAAVVVVVAALWGYIASKINKLDLQDGSQENWTNTDGSSVTSIANLKYLNILLLGTDERAVGDNTEDFDTDLQEGARADACMLVSLNLRDHTIRVVSLERALGVQIDGYGEDWLTNAFAYGGADLSLKTVRENFQVDVRRYVRVNVSSASQIIDAIGGVDVELTQTEADALNGKIPTNCTTRHTVTAGVNHLDGFDAVAFCRLRHIDSDLHRVQRQRTVLQAAINQAKTLSLKEFDGLLNVMLPLIQTNFTKAEITALLPKVPAFLGVQFKQMTLPLKGMYGSKYNSEGRSMMMPDEEEMLRVLNAFLYGDFDPDTYTASQEVVNRVWKAQQAAASAWAASHPESSSSESASSSEDGTQEDDADTTDDGWYFPSGGSSDSSLPSGESSSSESAPESSPESESESASESSSGSPAESGASGSSSESASESAGS